MKKQRKGKGTNQYVERSFFSFESGVISHILAESATCSMLYTVKAGSWVTQMRSVKAENVSPIEV